MMRHPFPLLLRRGTLRPHESLPSFILRLGQINFYEPITMMNGLCLQDTPQDRLDWPMQAKTYEHLIQLSWMDIYALHGASGHAFAKILTPLDREILFLQLPLGGSLPILPRALACEHLRSAAAVQFCPLCLKEAPYHRITWMPVAVAACHFHKCLLLDRCPKCQGQVSVRALVENHRCRRCGADLAQAPAPRLAHDELGLTSQRFIRWWLGLASQPHDRARYGPVLQLNPRVLFFLFKGLVDSITSLGTNWDYMHSPSTHPHLPSFQQVRGKPTPSQSYRLYATAFKALIDWPQNFLDFLRAYTGGVDRKAPTGVWEDLGKLYSKWLDDRWKCSDLRFVQRVFAHHLVRTYVPAPEKPIPSEDPPTLHASVSAFISSTRAARLLEVSRYSVKRLISAGFLVKYTHLYGEPRHYGFVRQDEVLTLRLAWERGVPLTQAAHWLGLTRGVVVDLVRVGLLTATPSSIKLESEMWLFDKLDLDRCYCALITRAQGLGRKYSILAEAARVLAVLELKVADILALIANGSLACWKLKEAPALAALSFDVPDIENLLMQRGSGEEILSAEQAAQRLGTSSITLVNWIESNLLAARVYYAFEVYLDAAEVERFRANYMFLEEAASLLGIPPIDLELWHQEWGLEAVRGRDANGRRLLLYLREDVKKLSAELDTVLELESSHHSH